MLVEAGSVLNAEACMKNTKLINVADYAIVVLKYLASTAVAPHLPRWPPPAGPEALGCRSA